MNNHRCDKFVLSLICMLWLVPINSYENMTHQKLSNQAIIISIQKGGIPSNFFTAEQQIALIDGAGSDYGEDYTTYWIDLDPTCGFRKRVFRQYYPAEVLSHFKSGLLWGSPAFNKFREFYQDAIDLWKNGNKEDATFILGRACHMIQDMAQPQHAMDEWHCFIDGTPSLKLQNPSYIEHNVEANLTSNSGDFCENSQYEYATLISNISEYNPVGIWMLTESNMEEKGMSVGNIYLRSNFSSEKLASAYGYGRRIPCDSSGNCMSLVLPFQFSDPRCGAISYKPKYEWLWVSPDSATYMRVDLAMKIIRDYDNSIEPGRFENSFSAYLLSPAVSNSAALIVAFWNEVKDPKPCGSNGGLLSEDSGICPTCGGPPVIPTPAGDMPDDSVFVKSSTVESGQNPKTDDWRTICRVGIGKGLSTMADYGVSSDVMDQLSAMDENSDPETAQALYDKLDWFMQKYSGPQNTMPIEAKEAPFVAIAGRGFPDSAEALINYLGEPLKILEEPSERVLNDEESLSIIPPRRGILEADPSKQKILILPTGSLFGLRKDSLERAALQSYAEQGGIIICFTQAYGDDFTALPVPEGEELLAAGYKQDVSCFSGSAYPVTDHPILSGITTLRMGCSAGQCVFRPGITAGFDGFFRKVPSDAEVLLRRTATGEPCFVLYPVGQGHVIVTTMFADWGYSNGNITNDAKSIIANAISWAKEPLSDMPSVDISEGGNPSLIPLDLTIRNLSSIPADQVEVIVTTPDRGKIVKSETLSISVPAGSSTVIHRDLDLSEYYSSYAPKYGIFHADYRLLALNPLTGNEEEIQPQGETPTGRFIVKKPDEAVAGLSDTVFSVSSDSDYAGNPQTPVHFHLKDGTGTARTFHIWGAWNHEAGRLLQTINLPAGGDITFDITDDFTNPGTYRYFLMDQNYGIPSQSFLGGNYTRLWGNDPWNIAGIGTLLLVNNSNDLLMRISPLYGLKAGRYDKDEPVTGSLTLESRMGVPTDMTVVFTIGALDQTVSSTSTVHLEPGATGEAAFDLSMAGMEGYFKSAKVKAEVFFGAIFMGSRTRSIAVESCLPKPIMTPEWPEEAELGDLGTITVNVLNSAAGSNCQAECVLKARVETLSPQGSPTLIEEHEFQVSPLDPGVNEDVAVAWSAWQPEAWKKYRVSFSLNCEHLGSGFAGAFQYRDYDIKLPYLRAVTGSSGGGESSILINGEILNNGDLFWRGQLSYLCPALGDIPSQEILVAPKSTRPITLSVARPDSLASGLYPVQMTFSSQETQTDIIGQGVIRVSAPVVTLLFPEEAPLFRHDRDAELPVKISVSGSASTVRATLNATLDWEGGSIEITSGEQLLLEPEQPSLLALNIPVSGIDSPGPFGVNITIHIEQGSSSFAFHGGYVLGGSKLAASFVPDSTNPSGTINCELFNEGAFEGDCDVDLVLTDPYGQAVFQDSGSYLIPIEGSVVLDAIVPNVLPGDYEVRLDVWDKTTEKSHTFSKTVEVGGTAPSLTLSHNRKIYGTADSVNLSALLHDPQHICGSFGVYTFIERYIGKGEPPGPYGPPGTSWSVPGGGITGNSVVKPSEWFVDPIAGMSAYAVDGDDLYEGSDVVPVALDLDNDGMDDVVSCKEGILRVSSYRALEAGASGIRNERAKKDHAGSRHEGLKESFLSIRVDREWGDPEDEWTRCFMLAFRDEAGSGSDPLIIGMYDPTAMNAAVLCVNIGGSLLWRRDYQLSYPYDISSFGVADLNRDGAGDIILLVGNIFTALNGSTGETLWQMDEITSYLFGLTVGDSASGPMIWTFTCDENGDKVLLIDSSGIMIRQYDVPSGYTHMSTGDVDGDGDDEAVLGCTDNQIYLFDAEEETFQVFPLNSMGRFGLYDISGDGRKDIVYSKIIDCSDGGCVTSLTAADLMTSQVFWTREQEGEGTPVFYKNSSDEIKILHYPERGEDYHGHACLLDASTGTLEQFIENFPFVSDSCLAGDFNGDGVSEFVLYGTMLLRGCDNDDGTAGACQDWETVWENYESIDQNGRDTVNMDYDAGTIASPGFFRTACFVDTENGQFLDSGYKSFTVVEETLGLSLSPEAGKSVRTVESYEGSITVANMGTAEEEGLNIVLSVDDQEYDSWQPGPLQPGAERIFNYSIPPASQGKHKIDAHVEKNGNVLDTVSSSFFSIVPPLDILVSAPEYHLGEMMEIGAAIVNRGETPASIEVALSDDPSEVFDLQLPPYQSAAVSFARQAGSDYSSTLFMRGDAERSVPVFIPFGYDIELKIPELPPLAKGIIQVPVQIHQDGPATYSGSLVATLTTQSEGSQVFAFPVRVGPGETKSETMVLSAEFAGSATLAVSASSTSSAVQIELAIYDKGTGSLEITLPQIAGEGLVSLPYIVRNSIAAEGSFTIALVSGEAGPVPIAQETIVVEPLGVAEGSLSAVFPSQSTTLTVLLNGVAVASGQLEVVDRFSAELLLEPVMSPDALPVLKANVINKGYEAFDARLVFIGGTVESRLISLDSGGAASVEITINPESYGGSSALVQAGLHLPDGSIIEKEASLQFESPQMIVAIPPAPITIIPGQVSPLTFTLSNSGDLSADVSVEVEIADGEAERFAKAAIIPGHSSVPVAVNIPLAADIPGGKAEARYAVRDNGSGEILSEGDLAALVEGPRVHVSASIDGAAYDPGTTATMTVNFSLDPPASDPMTVVAKVSAGPYETEEVITVAGARSETFQVPIDENTDSVSVDVTLPTGRSIYINRFRIYPLTAGFSIHPVETVYDAGEDVVVAAHLPAQGSLELTFRDQEVTLSGNGSLTQSFTTPLDAREDSYLLYYEYTPEDPAYAPASGSIAIDVHGVVATAGESRLSKAVYHSGEEVSGQLVIRSDRDLAGSLEYFLTYPDGDWIFLGKENITVSSGAPSRRQFSFPFVSTTSGNHNIGFMFVGASREIYVEGALPFSSGKATLVSLSTEKADYPEGSEQVEAIVKATGTGSAAISIFMDGTLVNQQQIDLDGTQTDLYSLGAVGPKTHTIKAVLTDSFGQESKAYTSFIYGSKLPDLTGFVSTGGQNGDLLRLACIVQNKGISESSAFRVALYEGDPQGGGVLMGNVLMPAIEAGGTDSSIYDWDVAGRTGEVFVYCVIDTLEEVREWDETNNFDNAALTIFAAPAITVTPEEGSCSSEEVTPSVTVTPEGYSISMTMDGEPFELGSSVAGEGEHLLSVTASNIEGASFSLERNFTIDHSAPSVEIASPVEGETVEPGFVPVVISSDPENDTLAILLDGQEYAPGTPIYSEGQHALTASASDDCGNTSSEITRNFTVEGETAGPEMPEMIGDFAFFGCDSMTANGSVKTYGVPSVGGSQGFGGHVGSNGDIKVSGANFINGDAAPGPGHSVFITGNQNQVQGSKNPADAVHPCEEGPLSEWVEYAQANNNNSQIPTQFMDQLGNMVINGSRTCSLTSGTYIVSSLTINGSAKLIAQGKVVMVITGALTINGGCSVNNNGIPGNLLMVSSSSGAVMINGGAKTNLQLYAPLSTVIVNGSVKGHGGIWGKSLTANGSVIWSRIE